MISNDISATETVRNVFVIDDKGIIRTILVYPMNVGRCIPEILRIIEALQTSDMSNGSIPANWIPCEPIINQSPRTFEELTTRNEQIQKERNGMNWYLSFKNPQKCITTEKECNKIGDSNKENKR